MPGSAWGVHMGCAWGYAPSMYPPHATPTPYAPPMHPHAPPMHPHASPTRPPSIPHACMGGGAWGVDGGCMGVHGGVRGGTPKPTHQPTNQPTHRPTFTPMCKRGTLGTARHGIAWLVSSLGGWLAGLFFWLQWLVGRCSALLRSVRWVLVGTGWVLCYVWWVRVGTLCVLVRQHPETRTDVLPGCVGSICGHGPCDLKVVADDNS